MFFSKDRRKDYLWMITKVVHVELQMKELFSFTNHDYGSKRSCCGCGYGDVDDFSRPHQRLLTPEKWKKSWSVESY
jgi:hypothetical protein